MILGFIGCGNMAQAIIKGLVSSQTVAPCDIYAYDVYAPATEKAAADYGITTAATVSDLLMACDVAVLAVKPHVIGTVLTENAALIRDRQPLLVSIAAGKTIAYLEEYLLPGAHSKIVRVMPNINAKAGEAMCGYCANSHVTSEDEEAVKRIFSAAGLVKKVEEALFPVFGVVAGCGPAFTYMFIDALARAGVKNGLKKQEALEIAAQTVLGSAKLILEGGEHPWALIDQVCSPGGTTIEAVTSLQADGMEAAVHRAVDQAVAKDSKL